MMHQTCRSLDMTLETSRKFEKQSSRTETNAVVRDQQHITTYYANGVAEASRTEKGVGISDE